MSSTPGVIAYLASAVVGLVVGCGLTSVIERVPAHVSLMSPGPRCPTCAAPVLLRDDVPVVSWVLLRARCRACSQAISARYPAVEAVTAALFVGVTLRFGVRPVVLAYWLFAATLVAVSAIDLEHFIVPNHIVYPVLAVTVPLLAVLALTDGTPFSLARAAIGGAVGFGVLVIIHLVQPSGMGFGDVRLAGVIGIYLGWLGIGEVALGLVLGFVVAAVVGIGLLAAGRAGRKTKVPFAPFLAVGAMATVFWGTPLLALWKL
ncbi:MAG: prepilin peptidase [Acidimicrobiales bacterium]